jgi:hypothetical protein
MWETVPRAPRALLAAAILAALVAPPVAAQRFSLAPTVGLYMPTTDLVSGIVNGGGTVSFKQNLGLALGGRVGLAFGSHFAISATGSYVPKSLQATVTETGVSQNTEEYNNLWFGTGRVNVWLLPPSSALMLGVNGGVGVVGRGETVVTDDSGNQYTDPSRTDIGGVVGGTVGLSFGGFGLFVSVDDYIYQPGVFEELGVKAQTQNDLQFSFGLGTRF